MAAYVGIGNFIYFEKFYCTLRKKNRQASFVQMQRPVTR